MLRRYRSKSSHRLSRRKSTSSVHSTADSIDPHVARQHAQAAATYAFVRAQERSSADTDRRDGLFRNNSTSSYHQGMNYIEPQNVVEGQGQQPMVRRQQSVRFSGSAGVRKSQSFGQRGSRDSQGTTVDLTSAPPIAMTNEVAVPAAYRPPSRRSSIGKCPTTRDEDDIITGLIASDEYYTQEDDIASTPSSYRRIQRSKSLSSQLRIPEVFFSDGTPSTNYDHDISIIRRRLENEETSRDLRAPKSMSFLRGGRDHLTPSLRQEHDVAVQIARDKFLHQIEQQRLRQQPSFLFRSRARQQERSFRKTVRSSNFTTEDDTTFAPEDQLKDGKKIVSIKEKARKVSLTLKNKIKGFFKRTGGDDSEKLISDRQSHPRSSHSSDGGDMGEVLGHEATGVPSVDNVTLSRVSSRVPSLHNVPSNRQLRSRTGSVSSLRSNGSSKSRVTSWTNSALDSTASSRLAQAERERQRLSIIQENGTHVPSSSFSRPLLRRNQASAYPVLNSPRHPHTGPPPMPVVIDSHMVYSALMQRIDEKNSSPNLGRRIRSIDSLRQRPQAPSRSRSVGSRASSQAGSTPATIRRVHYDNDDNDPLLHDSYQTDRDQDDVFSPESDIPINFVQARGRSERRTSDASTVVVSRLGSNNHSGSTEIMSGPTLQEVALRDEPVLPSPRGLREIRSTFFGTSAITTFPHSTSPYRRALAESGQKSALAPYPPAAIYNYAKPPFNQSTGSLLEPAYTESIYSRTTSGRTPAPPETPFAAGEFFGRAGSGSGDRGGAYSSGPSHGETASGGSAEWKNWMSAQVSSLEAVKDNSAPNENETNQALILTQQRRQRGHVRERAQIIENETDSPMHRVASFFEQAAEDIHIQQHNSNNNSAPKSILKKKPSSVSDELQMPVPTPVPTPPPPAPPIPTRSPLRLTPAPSVNSVRSNGTGTGTSWKSDHHIPIPIVPPPTITTSSERRTISNGRLFLLNKRSSNGTLRSVVDTPTTASTTTKLVKKNMNSQVVPLPSPARAGIGRAVEKQFGSVGSRMSTTTTSFSFSVSGKGRENLNPNLRFVSGDGVGVENDVECGEYEADVYGAGLMGPLVRSSASLPLQQQQFDTQTMGSQRMVDLFLSGRRRYLAGSGSGSMSDEDHAFL